MAKVEQTEDIKNGMITLQAQINRLNKSLNCFREPETEALSNFTNSIIGQEIEEIRRCIRDQESIFDAINITGYINDLKNIQEQKKRSEIVENLISEREILNNMSVELDKALIMSYRSQKELTQQLVNIKLERLVLNHLIKSENKDVNDENLRCL